MSIDDIKKLDRKLFRLLNKYSKNHSHTFFKDDEGNLNFVIRIDGGFDGLTIEGIVDDNMFKNLEEALQEMVLDKPKIKQRIDTCVYSNANDNE